MKKIHLFSLLAVVSVLSGCSAIGTIFKGGMWFGIFMVVAVIGLVIFFLTRSKQ